MNKRRGGTGGRIRRTGGLRYSANIMYSFCKPSKSILHRVGHEIGQLSNMFHHLAELLSQIFQFSISPTKQKLAEGGIVEIKINPSQLAEWTEAPPGKSTLKLEVTTVRLPSACIVALMNF